jgi:hypothetical protein
MQHVAVISVLQIEHQGVLLLQKGKLQFCSKLCGAAEISSSAETVGGAHACAAGLRGWLAAAQVSATLFFVSVASIPRVM